MLDLSVYYFVMLMCSMADVNKQYNGVFYLYNYMYLFVAYFSAAQKKPC